MLSKHSSFVNVSTSQERQFCVNRNHFLGFIKQVELVDLTIFRRHSRNIQNLSFNCAKKIPPKTQRANDITLSSIKKCLLS